MFMPLAAFTALHVTISLVALVLGVLAILRLFGAGLSPLWTGLFLLFAAATTVTGFMFPFIGVTPAFGTGIVAGAVLIAVVVAQMLGRWPALQAGGIVASHYFLVFVTIAQIFNKTIVVNDAGQTIAGLAFGASEAVALAVYVVIGVKAVREI